MATIGLGIVGAGIGSLFGDPKTGFMAGVALGGVLFPPKNRNQNSGQFSDMKVTQSSYNAMIPLVYGTIRLGGNIIWSTDMEARRRRTRRSGKGTKRESSGTYDHSVSLAIMICQGPIGRIDKIWAEDRLIYDADASPTTKFKITTYLGDETQVPNSTIEGILGVGNVPAYRGRAYVVLEDFDLAEFGNRIPNFQFKVTWKYPGPTLLKDVLTDIFTRQGLTALQYDVANATETVSGFIIDNKSEASEAIDPLTRIFAYDLIEVDGKLKTRKRGGPANFTFKESNLACRMWSGIQTDPPSPVNKKRTLDLELPKVLDLKYLTSVDDKYEEGNQFGLRHTKTDTQESVTVHTSLVLGDDFARQQAERMLYDIWLARTPFTFVAPYSHIQAAAGDIVNLEAGGQVYRLRIINMDCALPGPIQFTAVPDEDVVINQFAAGGATPLIGPDLTFVEDTELIAWSSNAIRDLDVFDALPGFYAEAAGATQGDWAGCALYMSRDGGLSYEILESIVDEAIHGQATSVLAPGTSTGQIDTINTVDITIPAGIDVPETISDAELINGGNFCRLGNEYLQFGVVTALGGGAYRLSRLLRGRRGTDELWDTHLTGEKFVLVDDGYAFRINLDLGLKGKKILLKAVTAGQDISDVTPVTLYIPGDEFKCYSPANITGTRDGSDNLTINWVRRTRAQGQLQDNLDVPLHEDVESYDIGIRSLVTNAITGITIASQAVVTVTGHSFAVNDNIFFEGVKGMYQINGLTGVVVSTTASTITVAIDTTQFDAYVSGGTAVKLIRQFFGESSPTVTYTAAQQTTDFGAPQASVGVIVFQIGKYGRGYPGKATV